MRYFQIYDGHLNVYRDAEILLNGVSLSYAEGFGYVIPEHAGAPYAISIDRAGFQSLRYGRLPELPGWFFLIRPDEQYYYDGFVKRPCKAEPGEILLVLKAHDDRSQLIPREKLDKTCADIAVANELRLVSCEDQVDQDYGGRLRPGHYVMKVLNHAISGTGPVITALRQDDRLTHVGPAIRRPNEQFHFSVAPVIILEFEQGLSADSIRSRLLESGYSEVKFQYEEWYIGVRPGTLDGLNTAMENLHNLEGLKHARFQIIDIQS